ncbi:hypothetical protein PPTG_21881 [Phytophthora nicotianae INRA-310]|uniref:RxLR effector protein n=2 Tax=Phytophthora nicotianae TaxID=4792 RepID=W2QUI6_PHYN3|nr:hypothetical protein PPTG_21881 [Phytophthora nicotianae INRA-310]ETM31674.1 hypothetical protein L914_20785 [Phytophthora nicotianae]ETN16164.1 hypothetical protein PPTG_21881 [Phytophthora nicotianae INRA-310]
MKLTVMLTVLSVIATPFASAEPPRRQLRRESALSPPLPKILLDESKTSGNLHQLQDETGVNKVIGHAASALLITPVTGWIGLTLPSLPDPVPGRVETQRRRRFP